MVKQVLIEQWEMLNEIQTQGKENIYKDHITVQSFYQSSFSKNYFVISTGIYVKQMKQLRKIRKKKKKKKKKRKEK